MTVSMVAAPGVIVTTCFKAASTSVRNTFHVPWCKPLSTAAVRELRLCGWRIIGLLRDPIERLESAYAFFSAPSTGTYSPFGECSGMRDFVLRVLGGVSDPHWDAQVPQLNATEYCDLESAPLTARDNGSTRQWAVPEDMVVALQKHYAVDYAARGQAWPL